MAPQSARSVAPFRAQISRDLERELAEAKTATPPLDDPEAWLANRDLGRFPGPLSLEIRSPEQVDLIEAIPTPVHAYICDDLRLDAEGLRSVLDLRQMLLTIEGRAYPLSKLIEAIRLVHRGVHPMPE